MHGHRDAIGQLINVDATVLWGGGTTQYTGLPKGKVVKLTPKMVKVTFPKDPKYSWRDTPTTIAIAPSSLVVIDKLLEN